MDFEIAPVGSIFGKGNDTVRIGKHMKVVNIKTNENATFAVVVAMTCGGIKSEVKKVVVVPNAATHEEAFCRAKEQHKLSGEWATQVGVTLFKTNQDFVIPDSWERCEKQFHE